MIKVDTKKLIALVLASIPTKADTQRLLNDLGDASRAKWIGLAQSMLKTTRRDYIQSISELQVSGNKATIELTGTLPNMVEHGWSGGDLRLGLLGKNSRRKMSKDGHYYNVVPFRHGTPGTGGSNVGPQMPSAIHAAARKLKGTLSRADPAMAGGRLREVEHSLRWGERLQFGKSKAADRILREKKALHHTGSIYMGMIRSEKTYGQKTQSQYFTFRTITNAHGVGWIHPGIRAQRLSYQVVDYLGKVQGERVLAIMRSR